MQISASLKANARDSYHAFPFYAESHIASTICIMKRKELKSYVKKGQIVVNILEGKLINTHGWIRGPLICRVTLMQHICGQCSVCQMKYRRKENVYGKHTIKRFQSSKVKV